MPKGNLVPCFTALKTHTVWCCDLGLDNAGHACLPEIIAGQQDLHVTGRSSYVCPTNWLLFRCHYLNMCQAATKATSVKVIQAADA